MKMKLQAPNHKFQVYIGVGSNLGDRNGNCVRALEKMRWNKSINVIAVSKWRETEAITLNDEKQFSYINGAIKISTDLAPHELLNVLQNIERELGRDNKHPRCSARTIDLDILFFDDLVVAESDLVIPHPDIQKRKFVLEPLCDIEPELIHPVLKKGVRALLREARKR